MGEKNLFTPWPASLEGWPSSSERPSRLDYSLQELGSCMRFFLNATAFLTLVFWIIVQGVAWPVSLAFIIIGATPVVTAALFFLMFLRRLKLVQKHAEARRDIDLVSRSIWELNKSWIIRSLVGKIPTFIEEDTPRSRKGKKGAFICFVFNDNP